MGSSQVTPITTRQRQIQTLLKNANKKKKKIPTNCDVRTNTGEEAKRHDTSVWLWVCLWGRGILTKIELLMLE